MRLYFPLLLATAGIFSGSCATKHGGTEENPIKPSEKQSLADSTTRQPVSVGDLGLPTVNLSSQSVCNVDSKSDQILNIRVSTKDPYDYFQVRLCPDAQPDNCTNPVAFLDPNFLINAPSSGKYSVQVQGCLDKAHSSDENKLCGGWADQSFTFAEQSPQVNAIMDNQLQLRTQMQGVCTKIQGIMQSFVTNETDTSNALRKMVQDNLNVIGVQTCSDMLLSPQLYALQKATELLSLTQVAPVTNTPIVVYNNPETGQVIQQQNSGNTNNSDNSQFTQRQQQMMNGIIFLTIGSLGTFASGYGVYYFWQDRENKESLKAADDLQNLVKIRKEIEFFETKELITTLETIKEKINALPGQNLGVVDSIEERRQANAKQMKADLELIKDNGLLPSPEYQSLLQEAAKDLDLEKLKDPQFVDDLKLHMSGIMMVSLMREGNISEGTKLYKETLEPLTRFISNLEQNASLKDLQTTLTTKCGANCDTLNELNREIKRLNEHATTLKTSWGEYLSEMAGAVKTGFKWSMLSAVGMIIPSMLIFGPTLGTKATAVTAGVVGVTVTGQEMAAAHKKLKNPEITQAEFEMLSKKPGSAEFEQFKKDNASDMAFKEAEQKAKMSKGSLLKTTPFLVGTLVMGGVAALGVQQTVAGAKGTFLAEDPQQQFTEDYSKAYQEGELITKQYTKNIFELANGSCGK